MVTQKWNYREERKESKTRGSKDSTFPQKDGKNFFGYKHHSSPGVSILLIGEFAITTASVHDSKVDLCLLGMLCYRDKGYQGALCKVINGTMTRSSRNTPLTNEQIRRNLRTSSKRVPGERPYSVIKRVQNGGHNHITLVRRVVIV